MSRSFKKTKVELDLLTDIDMLLKVGKGIKVAKYHAIYQYTGANNRYMKDYDRSKESLYLKYWDINNF